MTFYGSTSSDAVGFLSGINDVCICPYNSGHVIGASRFQMHLMKCRRQNPHLADKVVICAYNQSHHVPEADLSLHLTVCRDYMAHKYQQISRVIPSKYMRTPIGVPKSKVKVEPKQQQPKKSNKGAPGSAEKGKTKQRVVVTKPAKAGKPNFETVVEEEGEGNAVEEEEGEENIVEEEEGEENAEKKMEVNAAPQDK